MSIDTLAYAKDLQAAGVPPQQAEVHAKALNTAVRDGVATKADIAGVKADIAELRADLRTTEARLLRELAKVDSRMLYLLIGQAISIVGLLIAILRLVR
jgi:hypothetical protein